MSPRPAANGAHAISCQRGSFHYRHDHTCDRLTQHARMCGFIAQTEHCIRTVVQDAASRQLHRADVHIAGTTEGEV